MQFDISAAQTPCAQKHIWICSFETQLFFYTAVALDYTSQDFLCHAWKSMGLLGFSSPPTDQRRMVQHSFNISAKGGQNISNISISILW